MDKMKKLGLTALAGSLVATTAYAGEMSVSGSAKVTYVSQDEKEGLSQFPVQFTLDDDGETIKADIYYSPEYLAMVDADLDEGKINENQDDSFYIDEIKRDLEELDDKEANEYLEELAKSILKLKK